MSLILTASRKAGIKAWELYFHLKISTMSKNIGILEIHHGRLVPVDILRTIGRVVGKDGVEVSTPFEVSLTDLKISMYCVK